MMAGRDARAAELRRRGEQQSNRVEENKSRDARAAEMPEQQSNRAKKKKSRAAELSSREQEVKAELCREEE